MNNTLRYAIAKLKMKKHLETDSAVANFLGIAPSAFSNYKTGQRRLPDTALALISEHAEISMSDMIAIANVALKNTTEGDASFWIDRMSDDLIKIGMSTVSLMPGFNPSETGERTLSNPRISQETKMPPEGGNLSWRKRRDSNPR